MLHHTVRAFTVQDGNFLRYPRNIEVLVAYLKLAEISTLLRPSQCWKTCGWIRAGSSCLIRGFSTLPFSVVTLGLGRSAILVILDFCASMSQHFGCCSTFLMIAFPGTMTVPEDPSNVRRQGYLLANLCLLQISPTHRGRCS